MARRTPEQNRATYQRRQARSQAIYGRGYGAKGGARKLRALNQVLPADVTARPKPIHVSAAGQLVTKTAGGHAQRHLERAIETAASRGQDVSIRVTFDTAAGPRTRILDRRIADAVRGGGGGQVTNTGPQGAIGDPIGAIQVTAGGGKGVSAADLLGFVEDWYDGDYWEALHDLYDYLYE